MTPDFGQYQFYTVEDFVLDGDFIAWCKELPGSDPELWTRVLNAYPAQAENIRNARKFLLQTTIKKDLPSAGQQQKIWQDIQLELNLPGSRVRTRRMIWLRLAVAAAVLIAIGGGWYYFAGRQKEIRTQFGEIKRFVLPDGSKITLNGNSSIRYAYRWDAGRTREVWIDGEGYFEVNHLHTGKGPVKPGELFIVHAGGVDIDVLGTSFDVDNRHEKARIVLTTGSIELKFADRRLHDHLMKPGEFVGYSRADSSLEEKEISAESAGSWKDGHWTFDNTPLKEILELLKDDYGLEAKVEDAELWKKKVSGSISSDNQEILIQGLSVLLDIKIDQTDKTLVLKK
jgi:ferric-dicitrate binding protein FerR (iron transport regulator)